MQDVTSDDIATLRSRNISDDTILEKLGTFDPSHAKDFQTLKDRGVKPAEIIDKYVQFRQKNPSADAPPEDSTLTSVVKGAKRMAEGAAYGIGNLADMTGATSKALGLGDGSTSKKVSDFAHGFANQDGEYQSAGSQLTLNPKTWLQYGPRAAVESAPYALALLGAAAAAPEEAGLLAAGGAGAALHLGQNAEARAHNNGHDNVTTQDVLAAAPGSIVQGGLDAAGARLLPAGPLKAIGAGAGAMGRTAANVAIAGAGNAAVGGASDLAGQVGTTLGTDKGLSVDPSQAAQAALASGVGALGQKAVSSLPEVYGHAKFSGIDNDIGAQVAQDLKSTKISGDPNNPSDTAGMLKTSGTLYTKEANDKVSALRDQAKAAQAVNQPSAHLEEQADKADNLLANLKNANLDEAQIKEAKQQLDPDLADTIQKIDLVKQLQNKAGDFAKPGSQINGFDALRALHHIKRSLFQGGIAGAVTGSPLIGGAWAAAPFVLAGLQKAGQVITRTPHTIGDFVNRFENAGTPGSPTNPLNGTLIPPGPNGGQPGPQGPQGGPSPAPQLQAPPPTQLSAPPRGLPDYSNVIHMGQAPRETGADLPYRLMALRAAMQGRDTSGAPPAPVAPQVPIDSVSAPSAEQASAIKALARLKAGYMSRAAKAEYDARSAPEKPVQAPVAPKAPEGASGAPKVSTATPESSISIDPSAKVPNDFVEADLGEHGKMVWHQNTIRKGDNGAAKAGGAKSNLDIRNGITEAAKGLNLSSEGMRALPSILEGLKGTNKVGWNDNETSARAQVAKAAEGLPEADRPKFIKHFETHKHNGHGYYKSWKARNKHEKVANDKVKVAKFKERTTKRAKAAQKAN